MRVELIGHFKPCMTEIYLYIDARMAYYIHTHPYMCELKCLMMVCLPACRDQIAIIDSWSFMGTRTVERQGEKEKKNSMPYVFLTARLRI